MLYFLLPLVMVLGLLATVAFAAAGLSRRSAALLIAAGFIGISTASFLLSNAVLA
jgi:hypothetical protein